MAKQKRNKWPADETLDDLLKPMIDAGTLTEWCKQAGIHAFTLLRVRTGRTRPTTGTLTMVAIALKVPVERVRLAAERSLAARLL